MKRSTIAGLLGAALAAASGCRGAPGDVLLVSVDTQRADRVGLYGYERETTPHLDRWFADGAVYLRAYATSASTTPSVVSLLSGRPPHRHGVRLLLQLLPDELDLVTDHLPDRYQSAAFVSNAVLTDESLGIARRFDHYDDFVDEREPNLLAFERNASRTTDAALSWLREERDPRRPLFLWIHYIDPHGPYRPPTKAGPRFSHEGERPLESERVHRFQLEPGVTDALDYVDRYDEEVAYVDAQVGRLLEGYARLHGW